MAHDQNGQGVELKELPRLLFKKNAQWLWAIQGVVGRLLSNQIHQISSKNLV
jgi:hypothetical protein